MMKPKSYFLTTLILFVIVGTLHLLRVLNEWDMVLGGYQVPAWLSWLAVVVLGILAFQAYKLEKKS